MGRDRKEILLPGGAQTAKGGGVRESGGDLYVIKLGEDPGSVCRRLDLGGGGIWRVVMSIRRRTGGRRLGWAMVKGQQVRGERGGAWERFPAKTGRRAV